jgi:hypothetical protein
MLSIPSGQPWQGLTWGPDPNPNPKAVPKPVPETRIGSDRRTGDSVRIFARGSPYPIFYQSYQYLTVD